MGKDKTKKKDKVSAATARRIKIESNALMDGFFGFPMPTACTFVYLSKYLAIALLDGFFGFPVPTAFLLSYAYSNMGCSTYSYSYVRPT